MDMGGDDLEGNWAPGVTDSLDDVISKPAKLGKGKKRKLASKQAEEAAANTGPVAADAERPESAAAKKRRKRAKRKQGLAEGDTVPDAGADPEVVTAWAAARFSAAWSAEVQASSLSPLEAKEFRPVSAWFLPISPGEQLRRLPRKLPSGWDAAKLVPKSVFVVVLCNSAERAFVIAPELSKAMSSKPLVLASHGGGRKGDQVKRQAASIAKGAHLAVATPGRLLRLLDEGHLQVQCLRCIIIDLCRDRKQRDVLSLPETRRDVLGLMRRHCAQPLEGRQLRVAMCGAP